jgi:hypothetical protein
MYSFFIVHMPFGILKPQRQLCTYKPEQDFVYSDSLDPSNIFRSSSCDPQGNCKLSGTFPLSDYIVFTFAPNGANTQKNTNYYC